MIRQFAFAYQVFESYSEHPDDEMYSMGEKKDLFEKTAGGLVAKNSSKAFTAHQFHFERIRLMVVFLFFGDFPGM